MIQRLNKIYSESLNFVKKYLEREYSLEKVFALLGLGIVSYAVSRTIFKFANSFILRPETLIQRYGSHSWAIITGPTGGIGREFAKELAKQGFSICLLGRGREKMEKLIRELEEINGKIATKIVSVDFTESLDTTLWRDITQELEYVDPAILVNNVGMGLFDLFADSGMRELRDTISVNCVAMTHLTRHLIDRMMSRKKRSAILNMSCIEGTYPYPFISIYSATKAYVDSFSRSLAGEVGHKIDVISYTPYVVKTNLSILSKSRFMISPEDCVQSCLKALGKTETTAGHWKHRLVNYVRRWYPLQARDIIYSFTKNTQIQEMKSIDQRFENRKKIVIQ